MKKKRLFILFMIFILCMVGCKAKGDNNNVQERFNVQIAKETAIEYMERLKANDIDGANAISTPEIKASNKIKKLTSMPIMAFQTANINETGNSAYISFYCTRTNGNLSDANLDLVNIKIVKGNEEYIISDVKSENISEIYHEKDELRLITKGEGSSQLILRLKDLPLQVYPKGQKPVINKVKVPKDKYSVIGISYTGSNIAVSTTDGKNSFIGVAIIEEANVESSARVLDSKLAQDQGGGGSAGTPLDEDTLKKALEKPVAQQISGYDVLEDSKIKTLMFNEEEGVLIVQYTKGNGNSLGMKIYSNPDGDLFPIEFEKLFPMDKYSIEYVKSTKNDLVINVTAMDKKNISQEVLGSYKIDLIQKTIEKI
mgnify:CR=1 FL=1